MYLHSLELHGFKSFADRTEIQFSPGVTAIVGPNGCGKSNIIDAVRWVLGEQRSRMLRSEKMDNVIFNGTAKRKAVGMSEVSLTIENTRNVLPTQYTHVTVTRRLYRSGESEYLINKTPCRLKDIIDLFMDTGMGAHAYSVIELKMTDEILSDNAQDRRSMFEEAAGITKYKLRRTQALRKLKSTQTDLLRVRDLVDELDKRVQSLSRQAQKAGRHRDLADQLRTLELQVAQVEYGRLVEESERLEEESRREQDRIEGLTTTQSGREALLEELRTELVGLEQQLSERQRTLNAHVERVRAMEADIRLEMERAAGAARNLERAEQDRVASERQAEHLAQEARRLATALEGARPLAVVAREAFDAASAERDAAQEALEGERKKLEALRRGVQALQDRMNGLINERNRLGAQVELLERQREQTAKRRTETEAGLSTQEQERLAAESAVEGKRAEVVRLAATLREAEAEQAALELRREEVRTALGAADRHLASIGTEIALLEGLVASYDDLSESVAFLARESGWSAEGAQTVAELLSCAEEDRAAVDALLGDLAACFVVSTEAEAEAGLRLLRDREKGRAAFLVLDRVPELPAVVDGLPGIRHALDAVRVTDARFERLAQVLLSDGYIVETLEEARGLAMRVGMDRPSARFAARTGEWAEGRGRYHGGSLRAGISAAANRIGRRERLDGLRGERDEVTERVRALGEEESRVAEALEELGVAVRGKALREAERQVDQSVRVLDQVRFRVQLLGQGRDRLDVELADALQRIEEIGVRLQGMDGEVEAAGGTVEEARSGLQEAERRFEWVDEQAREAFARFGEANLASVQARNEVDSLERDLRRVESEVAALGEREKRRLEQVEGFRVEMDRALASRERLEEQVLQSYREKSVLDTGVSEAEAAVSDVKSRLSEHDVALRDVRRIREEALRQEGNRAARRAELRARCEDLVLRVRDAHDVMLDAMTVEVADDFDLDAAREAIPEVRQKIRNLGAVNELALESYREEKERLDFLGGQLADLEAAEGTLMETIDEINTTASERFMETFEAVKRHFSQLFTELFGEGARADLVLTGDEDPLEAPIEVIAYPLGKKPSTISQLSGGEKTLTATALLFAIYLVKPSPFCILDEVDAPLDDANVHRFMRMIRAFSGSTQFILVTHNKLTMEAADRLYGVTMPEQGVSRLVGVRFDELEVQEEVAA